MSKNPLLYPDPIVNLQYISNTLFLYFDSPIIMTTPPVITLEKDSLYLINKIKKEQPQWEDSFFKLLNLALFQIQQCHTIKNKLEPLNKTKLLYISYPADIATVNNLKNKINTLKDNNPIHQYINPLTSSGEIMRHIFLEVF